MSQADEHHRAPLLWLLAPGIVGMALAASGVVGVAGLYWITAAAGLAALASALTLARHRLGHFAWIAALACAAALGGMAHMHRAFDPGGISAHWRGLPAREGEIELEITRLFPAADDAARCTGLGVITHAPPPIELLAGQRVSFAAALPPPAHAGDNTLQLVRTMHVRAAGVLRRIDETIVERGTFDAYLLSSGVPFRFERAEVRAITRAPTRLARFFDAAGARFEAILRRGLPESHPATSVYVAMFLGRKSELSDAQKESYLRSGTMHLFAISGLHIAMIAACLHTLLSVGRVPPRLAAVIGLVALWIFVEATGGTPSARRAFLMVACVWAGSTLRRPANPVASVVASAFVVLVWDPLALLSTSFQLSYSVVVALLLYGLPLRHRWHARWSPWRDVPGADWRWWQRAIHHGGRNVLTLAAISVSATLVSTPLGLAYFGLASPGGLLSNLVLVPLTGSAVGAGFAALVCGLAGLPAPSEWFNHAAVVIVWIVDIGARGAAAIPGMFFHGSFTAGWMAPAIVGTMLALFVAGYARGWDRFPGRWWTPAGALIGLLVFLVTPGAPAQESAGMKSAYELAMERLRQSDPDGSPHLSAEQKTKLAEIDRVYQGKIAEREIFLQQRLAETRTNGDREEAEKIRQQIASERARLEEDREDEKNRVRRTAGGKP